MKETTNQLTIRAADISEAGSLTLLTHAAFAEYEKTPYPSRVAQETAETIRGQMAAGVRVFVAERDGWKIACVRCRVEGDALYFFRLAVHPSARRQGIATQIIDHLRDVARTEGLAKLTCCVRERENGNVALYAGLGFLPSGKTEVAIRGGNEVLTVYLEKAVNTP